MSTASAITEQCLKLIKESSIPITARSLVEMQIQEIKNLLEHDQFINTRCDFFAEGRFEEMLRQVQEACKEPSQEAIHRIVNSTSVILSLLGHEVARPEASPVPS